MHIYIHIFFGSQHCCEVGTRHWQTQEIQRQMGRQMGRKIVAFCDEIKTNYNNPGNRLF